MPDYRPHDGITPGDVDPPPLPPDVLRRYRARMLDPVAGPILADHPGGVRPTAYVIDRILVRPATGETDTGSTLDVLNEAIEQLGLAVRVVDSTELPHTSRVPLTRMQLVVRPTPTIPIPTVDAWRVLQYLRSLGSAFAQQVQLDHLMQAGGGTGQDPPPSTTGYHSPNPLVVGSGAQPGSPWAYGIRQPVAWLGGPPHRHTDDELRASAVGTDGSDGDGPNQPAGPPIRRPVVAIVDGGCDDHDWFRQEGVLVEAKIDDVVIGMGGAAAEWAIDPFSPMDGSLSWCAGHGTFEAGVVLQVCPDARIMPVRVFDSDGIVPESYLIDVLGDLAEVARRYVEEEQEEDKGPGLDVVSLSLGCTYETRPDISSHPALYAVLEKLGTYGVTVCASAGNAATQRPLYPAGYAPNPGGPVSAVRTDCVPLISVGALNLDGPGSVAAFSNSGLWVRHFEIGVSLVSTFPTVDGGASPETEATDPSGRDRRSLDPDDFSRGFARWDGTSFAAPVLAGRLAAQLLKDDSGVQTETPEPTGAAAVVRRAWEAVEACTALRRTG